MQVGPRSKMGKPNGPKKNGEPNGNPKKNPSSKSKSPSNPNPNPQFVMVWKHGCASKCGGWGVITTNGAPCRDMPSNTFRIGGAPPENSSGPRATGPPIRRIG